MWRMITCHSPDETRLFAQRLADRLGPGDCILLNGPVGAGKSLFSRALIQHLLTTPEDVPSPTFTLVQTYDTPDFEIWHCDLYRLGHPDEVLELGLDQAFETGVALIEWPDKLGAETPPNALHLSIEVLSENSRKFTWRFDDPRWIEKLAGLADV